MNTPATPLCETDTMSQRIMGTLHDRIGPQKFNAWFKRGTRLDVEADHVRVSVPSPFVAHWIETHYREEISQAAAEHAPGKTAVVVTIDPELAGQVRQGQLDTQAGIVRKAGDEQARTRSQAPEQSLRHHLADFVVGESNRLAFSAAAAITSAGESPFRLLVLHGSCGVGKTHLLQGICNAARKVAGLRWRYITGEQFTNEFVSALREKRLADFRARFRKLDLLAIDDMHFFAAKKATQEEFLHTFDAIQATGRIVMASDAHPKLVGDLNEQLVSRFLSGMVVRVETPDLATRMEILRRRAATLKVEIPQNVLEYIAMHIRGSVRELEGALVKVAALSALEGRPADLPVVSAALADHLARTGSALTLGDIESAAAAFFGITPADIQSSRRTRTVAAARMIAMHLARKHTQMSFPEIGRALGKNHSSVVLACQRMERLLAQSGNITWQTPMGDKSLPAAQIIDALTGQIAAH